MLAHAVAEYQRYLIAREYAPGTRARRLAVVRHWLADGGADVEDYRGVEAWLAHQPGGAGHRRNQLVHLHAWYRWLMRQGYATVDPTALVDAPRVKRRLPRPAPDQEIAAVMAVADPSLRAMVGVMAACGLRCCEVARLRWSDIDLAAGQLVADGKGSRQRVVYLPASVVRLFAALDETEGPVFRERWSGGAMSANAVSHRVGQAFRRQGFPTRAHQLRHRAATCALRVPGADLLDVRDLLGHADVSTTQVYTQVVPGHAAEIARAVSLPASDLGLA